jgi:type II secretory pathway pseudopilin PulG
MAALLVALGVMAIMMTVVLPVWRHEMQREKEAELIFRGTQYVRAIGLWERKNGPGTRPTSIDLLVQGRFLRKKFKDPMTEDGEFQLLYQGQQLPGQQQLPGGVGQGQRGTNPTGGGRNPQQSPGFAPQSPATGQGIGTTGIMGVASKSKETAIKQFQGRTHYNEWQFIFQGNGTAGGGARGTPGGGGRANQPGNNPRGGGRNPSRGVGPGGGFPGGSPFSNPPVGRRGGRPGGPGGG